MHKEAYAAMYFYFTTYMKEKGPGKVLDVGSMDINGTIKPIFKDWNYTGMDLQDGKNVDIILLNRKEFPFPSDMFDVCVSISTLEHDTTFWITLQEMERVTKHQGFIYISVPSAGSVHNYPVDCWRFMPDAKKAITEWLPSLHFIDGDINIKSLRKDNNMLFRVLK